MRAVDALVGCGAEFGAFCELSDRGTCGVTITEDAMFEEATGMSVAATGGVMSAWPVTTADSGVAVRAVEPRRTTCSQEELADGVLLAGRYRILYRIGVGWAAYDERLTRPVVVERLVGAGTPAERIRQEAAEDERLFDAIVVGVEAFAIRTTFTQ